MESMQLKRRRVRKETQAIGWSMLLYLIVSLLAPIGLDHLVYWIEGVHLPSPLMIVGQFGGFLVLSIFFGKSTEETDLLKSKRTITGSYAVVAICAMVCTLSVACVFSEMVHEILQSISLTEHRTFMHFIAANEPRFSKQDAESMIMFILAIPLLEGLCFRGYIMKHLKKYGKLVAILIPAAMAAFVQGNVYEGIIAFFVGVLLGFVATEYSFIGSVLLHCLKNMILVFVMPDAPESTRNEMVLAFCFVAVIFCTFVCALQIYRKREVIAKWVHTNTGDTHNLRGILTSVGMIMFIVISITVAVYKLLSACQFPVKFMF